MNYDLNLIENPEMREILAKKLDGATPGSIIEVEPDELGVLQTIMTIGPNQIQDTNIDDVPLPEEEVQPIEEVVSDGSARPDLHVLGAKDDGGKTRMGLVLGGFNRALYAVSEVGTFGANKYTDNGWKSVPMAVERYKDAMYRHLLASDSIDPESGLPHMAHAAWNALAILQFMIEGYEGGNTEA